MSRCLPETVLRDMVSSSAGDSSRETSAATSGFGTSTLPSGTDVNEDESHDGESTSASAESEAAFKAMSLDAYFNP